MQQLNKVWTLEVVAILDRVRS